MSREEWRRYFLVRAAVQILTGALIGSLIWALVPDPGFLHLLSAGIGFAVSLPLVAAAYDLTNGTSPRPEGD
jgi:hypothetical protein